MSSEEIESMTDAEVDTFYVCDLRPEFRGQPYVTFWRPHNANYAWPLEWSGEYTTDQLQPGYHEVKEGRSFIRFAVPCHVVRLLTKKSAHGRIDGGVYDVVPNSPGARAVLRANRFPLRAVRATSGQQGKERAK